jgi:hypothetical protein
MLQLTDVTEWCFHEKMDNFFAFFRIKCCKILGFLPVAIAANRGFTLTWFILLSWTCSVYDFAHAFAFVVESNKTNLLMRIFKNFPYCTMILRPVLVLSIACFKKSSKNPVQTVNGFLRTSGQYVIYLIAELSLNINFQLWGNNC